MSITTFFKDASKVSDTAKQKIDNFLTEILKEEREENDYVVVDVDHTITNGDVTEQTMQYMIEDDLLNPDKLGYALHEKFDEPQTFNRTSQNYTYDFVRKYFELMTLDENNTAYRFGALMAAGSTKAELRELVIKMIATESENEKGVNNIDGLELEAGYYINKEIMYLLLKLQEKGIGINFVSASPQVTVEILGDLLYEHLGLETDSIWGIQLEKEGETYLPKFDEKFPPVTYNGKVDLVDNYISTEYTAEAPLMGMGDSLNDYPMMALCKSAVAVDIHKTEFLKKIQKTFDSNRLLIVEPSFK